MRIAFLLWLLVLVKGEALLFLNVSISQCIVVTRASCEGSEDPGRGGDVSDRTESPGTFAEEELLQWRPSLLHGDPAKCDGHLQKSNLHPSFRRRAGRETLFLYSCKSINFLFHWLWLTNYGCVWHKADCYWEFPLILSYIYVLEPFKFCLTVLKPFKRLKINTNLDLDKC